MAFKTMDPNLIRDLIKDEPDVITPAAKVESELLNNVSCPVCGHQGASKAILPPKFVMLPDGSTEPVRVPFGSRSPIIKGHAKCDNCGSEFEPMTRVIISTPEPVITDPTPE